MSTPRYRRPCAGDSGKDWLRQAPRDRYSPEAVGGTVYNLASIYRPDGIVRWSGLNRSHRFRLSPRLVIRRKIQREDSADRIGTIAAESDRPPIWRKGRIEVKTLTWRSEPPFLASLQRDEEDRLRPAPLLAITGGDPETVW